MSFSQILRSFAENRCIIKGRATHGRIITSGCRLDVYTNNHLASMYLKFDRIDDARHVFDQMPHRNLTSWTSLICGYSRAGLPEEALNCFRSMMGDGFCPNYFTYVGVISACSCVFACRAGKEVHGRVYRAEGELKTSVGNSLVNMYGKCGLLRSARYVFDAISEPDNISWTSLLSTYCRSGENMEGLRVFMQSQQAGCLMNEYSCASVLGACAAIENFRFGIQIHTCVLKYRFGSDQFVMTSLINFYAKCGELESAHKVFLETHNPYLAAWTALIGGFAKQGKTSKAVDVFRKMYSSGLKPSDRTFASIFGAIVDKMEIGFGKQLHALIVKLGYILETYVGNSVLDFYAKCRLLEESSMIFEEMDTRDTVSWNALVSGHVESCHYKEARKLLHCMVFDGFEPNDCTYSTILSMCGDLSAIEWGKQTHCCIIKPGFDSNVVVGSTLIDMYAKCGRLVDAQKIFNNLSLRNRVSWNSMILGYAQHGYGRDALEIYRLMQTEGVEPNNITFLGILIACRHMGLLEEGWYHFNSMTKDYGITPRIKHIACMVSLLGRKGETRRAYELIMSTSREPDKVVWRCLLSACQTCKDLELGIYAAQKILSIDPDDASAHITLSNIYAEAKMWDEAASIRRVIKEKDLKKDTGNSWTELKNKVYSFASGYNMHSEGINLREVVDGLTSQLVDEGYIPDAALPLLTQAE